MLIGIGPLGLCFPSIAQAIARQRAAARACELVMLRSLRPRTHDCRGVDRRGFNAETLANGPWHAIFPAEHMVVDMWR